jgi:hypothetical protein
MPIDSSAKWSWTPQQSKLPTSRPELPHILTQGDLVHGGNGVDLGGRCRRRCCVRCRHANSCFFVDLLHMLVTA